MTLLEIDRKKHMAGSGRLLFGSEPSQGQKSYIKSNDSQNDSLTADRARWMVATIGDQAIDRLRADVVNDSSVSDRHALIDHRQRLGCS